MGDRGGTYKQEEKKFKPAIKMNRRNYIPMNGKESVQIARIDERCVRMHDDIKELKKCFENSQHCVNINELAISKLDTTLTNHLKAHKRDLAIVTIFVAVIAIILQFIPIGG